MEEADRSDFGTVLRQLRLNAAMTQQELAERANLSVEAISQLERGARTRPQRETVALLGRALDLSPEHQALLTSALQTAYRARPRDRSGRLNSALQRLGRADSRTNANHNLPQPLTSFVGRERELDEIAAQLREHRVVTIVGAGGVGKTRMALEVAPNRLERYPDGVWFVDLAPLRDRSLVGEAILSALQVPSTSGPAIDGIVAYLKRRRSLLLLDNCEHVAASVANIVTTIVQLCASVHILATSRQALEVAGEHVYRLPSLDGSPAARLFIDRARAADASFAFGDNTANAVAEICRRLDGIPLAIELAAARVQVLAPGQIAERLNQRFRLLASADSKALPRHRTMAALLDWSYDLLSAREQRFFDALSVFAGDCTLETAMAVCAQKDEDDLDVLDLIASLVSKSLLIAERSGEAKRYRLLESTRQYAANKLAERGTHDEFARRHAHAFLELAKTLEASLDSISDRDLADLSRTERENWRSALEWTLGTKHDVVLGQRIAATDASILWDSVTLPEGRRWVAKALELVDERTAPSLIADLELADAAMAGAFSESSTCLAAAQRALSRYRSLGDSLGIARAAMFAGHRLLIFERIAEGEALLLEGLATARCLRKHRLAADILRRLQHAGTLSGDFAKARAYVAEGLDIATAVGADLQAAHLLAILASIEYDAGDVQAAIRITGEALNAYRRLPLTSQSIATVIAQMANFLVVAGRYDEARKYATEALELAVDFRASVTIALALQILAVQAVVGARIAQLERSGACAAKLCGFVEAQMAAFALPKIYGLTEDYDRALEMLRDALGTEEVARLMAAGAAMTEDEAVNQAHSLD